MSPFTKDVGSTKAEKRALSLDPTAFSLREEADMPDVKAVLLNVTNDLQGLHYISQGPTVNSADHACQQCHIKAMDRSLTGYSRVNIFAGAVRFLKGGPSRPLLLKLVPSGPDSTAQLKDLYKKTFLECPAMSDLLDAGPVPLRTHANQVKMGDKYTRSVNRGEVRSKDELPFAGAPAISTIAHMDCVLDNISDAMHMLMNNCKGTFAQMLTNYISCIHIYPYVSVSVSIIISKNIHLVSIK